MRRESYRCSDQPNGLSAMDKRAFTADNLFSVRGRNALVTGATSGIGFMMAEGLIMNGIETLFITGIDTEDIIAEKVSLLQSLARTSGFNTTILGSVPSLYIKTGYI